MPTFTAKVDDAGAVVLPKELRDRLAIAPGATVEFFLAWDGQVHFHAITGTTEGLAELVVEKRSPPLSIREMDDAIMDAVLERDERSKSGRRPERAGQAAE
jgi:AbrB family looped-hinge helix DNA binding protein